MKIKSITQFELDDTKIIIDLEEYHHAQPVFNASISAKDLETALKAWKINQDAVDAINAAVGAPPKPVTDISHLDSLVGKTI